MQFATNHLGHFALASGLHGALAAGAAERDGARVVSVSSTAHMRAGIEFADIHFRRRDYDPQIAYAQSKTANSLFAVDATRRWASEGIVANTVNYKTIEQRAATSIVAAVAPEFARTGGHYLADGQEAYTVPDDADLAQHPHGVKEWALNPATAEHHWSVSSRLIHA
jgi:NAD(P)-dependent dehydrogenase (short-subunit alcohol dehydrogenase family)